MRIDIHDTKEFLKQQGLKAAGNTYSNSLTYQSPIFRIVCDFHDNYLINAELHLLQKNKSIHTKHLHGLKKDDGYILAGRFKFWVSEFLKENALVYFEDFYDEAILLNGFFTIQNCCIFVS